MHCPFKILRTWGFCNPKCLFQFCFLLLLHHRRVNWSIWLSFFMLYTHKYPFTMSPPIHSLTKISSPSSCFVAISLDEPWSLCETPGVSQIISIFIYMPIIFWDCYIYLCCKIGLISKVSFTKLSPKDVRWKNEEIWKNSKSS